MKSNEIKEPKDKTYYEARYEEQREVNLLTNPNFKVVIEEAPMVSLFSQTFTLPSVSAPAAVAVNPFVDRKMPADHSIFSDLSIDFLVDENMNNYYELYAWIMHLSFPRAFTQFLKMNEGLTGYPNLAKSNIYVHILSNKTNLIDVVKFFNCFPTSLGQISMDHTNNDVTHPTCNVTFAYDYFVMGRDNTMSF